MASATDPAAPDAPDDLTRLKTLLFREEQTRLSVIEGGVSRLDNRVGSADRLVETTSEIIVEALRRAEVERIANFRAPLHRSSLPQSETKSATRATRWWTSFIR